jgi:cytoskeletal protein CcmA (bactofilin family)
MRRDKKSRKGTATPTLIAKGTCIIGEVHFSGSLEIEGQVKGNIEADSEDTDASVRIRGTGAVIGQVKAPVVIVSGSVDGDIYAAKQVELASQAAVKGDIHYALLEIEKGAQVNGGFVQEDAGTPAVTSKAEKLEAEGHLEAVSDSVIRQP